MYTQPAQDTLVYHSSNVANVLQKTSVLKWLDPANVGGLEVWCPSHMSKVSVSRHHHVIIT
jgi:hypothetical protein